jgi:hypothetical protein
MALQLRYALNVPPGTHRGSPRVSGQSVALAPTWTLYMLEIEDKTI